MEAITWNDPGKYARCYECSTLTPDLREPVRVHVWAGGPEAARKTLERNRYTVQSVRLYETVR